jgi:NAD(P)-dependent dehydrogenase (short-subunit alcohol dehydrogenase family)
MKAVVIGGTYEEVWDQIFNVNLTGTLRACQIFGEEMLKRHFGRIINIAVELCCLSKGRSLWSQ